jgi:hypothetical protein
MVNELEKDSFIGQDHPQNGEEKWVFDNPTDNSAVIARFYYSFRGGNRQTSHELMLRSIVYQIWSANSKLFPLIQHYYRQRKEMKIVGRKRLWTYDALKSAIESLRTVTFNLSVFIVIDGMDESNSDKRVDILKFLLDLAHATPKGSCTIKIFITSRPENIINSRLRLVSNHIKLQEVNEEDIRSVVESWIKQMILEDKCEEETLREVKEYITEHSHGVFLWVTLVLRDLEQYIANGGYTKLTLKTRLHSLPKELGGKDGFYRTMVNLLVEKYNDDQERQELGRRILAWLTFAERPILVTELQHALATPSKLKKLDLSTYILEDNKPRQLYKAILSSCGGLAEVNIAVILFTSRLISVLIG